MHAPLLALVAAAVKLPSPGPALYPWHVIGQHGKKRKLSIHPGITCLWQVRGRNAIGDFNDWVEMDLEYIHHWSLWLDVKILARTACVVLAGTGK